MLKILIFAGTCTCTNKSILVQILAKIGPITNFTKFSTRKQKCPMDYNFTNTGEINPHIIIIVRKNVFFIWIRRRGLGS